VPTAGRRRRTAVGGKGRRRQGKYWTATITPEAGTVKNDEQRRVVLHPHLIELGFAEFVKEASSGHLFLRPSADGDVLGPLQGVKNRLAEFARELVPDSREPWIRASSPPSRR
jgi:hypothetical protein